MTWFWQDCSLLLMNSIDGYSHLLTSLHYYSGIKHLEEIKAEGLELPSVKLQKK